MVRPSGCVGAPGRPRARVAVTHTWEGVRDVPGGQCPLAVLLGKVSWSAGSRERKAPKAASGPREAGQPAASRRHARRREKSRGKLQSGRGQARECLAARPARVVLRLASTRDQLEDALGDLEALLLHPGKSGAGSMPDLCPLAEGPFLEDKVIVSSRVHGVEHVGVVRNLQLWSGRGRGTVSSVPQDTPPLESPETTPQLQDHQGPRLMTQSAEE